MLKRALPLILTISSVQAFPLLELTGNTTPSSASSYLSVAVAGEHVVTGDRYTISASNTTTTASNTDIHLSFTVSPVGLGPNDQIELSRIQFDYLKINLAATSAPQMDLYLDTGNGYGQDPILRETGDQGLITYNLPTDVIITAGQSITFGFSFRDLHGAPSRTHNIDNFVLDGFYDFETDTPIIDLDSNGVSDIWEYQYRATELIIDEVSRTSDYDGDGHSNIEEAILGTDPRDAGSYFRLTQTTGADSLSYPTVAGKRYTMFGNPDLQTGNWSEESFLVGNGNFQNFTIQPIQGVDRYFYRIGVSDYDGDGDGLSGFEESLVSGFSDSTANSNESENDYERLKRILKSQFTSSLTITQAGSATIYENSTDRLAITVTRVGEFDDDFLALSYEETYQITDTTQVASNAASTADYRLVDQNGNLLTNNLITMAPGVASQTIYIEAVPDSEIESDEQLTLSIEGQSQVDIWIADALTVEPKDYEAIAQAGLFLSQASMGGTPETISKLANEIREQGYLTACENWIDAQIALPRESSITDDCFDFQQTYIGNSLPSVNIQNFELVWWGKMVQTDEQLRHRLAFALSQVFVTSSAIWANQERNDVWRSYTGYYDKLADHAFLTHRDLLQTISYDPFMGVYLSSAQNKKADPTLGTVPDENYAREVMQLFSCGVFAQSPTGEYILDPADGSRIENYDNDDIVEMAKVFTGLGLSTDTGALANFDNPGITRGAQYVFPMQMAQDYHDTTVKTLLDGTVLGANRAGDADIFDALDVLAQHSSTAPHLSRLLIKRLTSSNPSGEYIGRVVEAWNGNGPYGTGQSGNFISIFKAILLDPEARFATVFTVDPTTGITTASPKPTVHTATTATSNLALGKNTLQSSTGHGGVPERAVDGNTDGNYNSGSTTHTNTEFQPWWQVDLGETSQLFSLQIWNRTNNNLGSRLANFSIFISETNPDGRSMSDLLSDPAVWSYTFGGTPGQLTEIATNAKGRYVRIQLPGSSNPLSLSEVIVNGVPDSGSDPIEFTSTSGRIKEPILKWTQFYRFAQSLTNDGNLVPKWDPLTKRAANDQTPDFGQIPMRAPSVFNYYDSEHSPSVGDLAIAEATYGINLTSPESEILSPFVIKQFEAFHEDISKDTPSSSFIYDGDGTQTFTTLYTYLDYLYRKNENVSDFIDDINLWLCNGQISPELKAELTTTANANGGATVENYAAVLSIIFNSSDFSVSF